MLLASAMEVNKIVFFFVSSLVSKSVVKVRELQEVFRQLNDILFLFLVSLYVLLCFVSFGFPTFRFDLLSFAIFCLFWLISD